MRNVVYAGAAAAVVFVTANFAIRLLNEPSDLGVAAGYFLLLGLVAAAVGVVARMWRRQ
jgi:hypothetical protein